MRQTLRKMGDSLVMTVPEEFVVQNGLAEGAEVALHLHDSTMLGLKAKADNTASVLVVHRQGKSGLLFNPFKSSLFGSNQVYFAERICDYFTKASSS